MSATESHLDGDQLIATRRLAAPVDLVWRAFTTPGHLAAFWGRRPCDHPGGVGHG